MENESGCHEDTACEETGHIPPGTSSPEQFHLRTLLRPSADIHVDRTFNPALSLSVNCQQHWCIAVFMALRRSLQDVIQSVARVCC